MDGLPTDSFPTFYKGKTLISQESPQQQCRNAFKHLCFADRQILLSWPYLSFIGITLSTSSCLAGNKSKTNPAYSKQSLPGTQQKLGIATLKVFEMPGADHASEDADSGWLSVIKKGPNIYQSKALCSNSLIHHKEGKKKIAFHPFFLHYSCLNVRFCFKFFCSHFLFFSGMLPNNRHSFRKHGEKKK